MAMQGLDCMANGKSPISSRNSVPPLAAWVTFAILGGAGVGAFARTKNSGFQHDSGIALQLTAIQGPDAFGDCWHAAPWPPVPCLCQIHLDEHRGHSACHFDNAFAHLAHDR